MDTFTDVAVAGSPNLATMAPGVSGALITTVMSLCVAIPAMFGYNFLVTSIRGSSSRWTISPLNSRLSLSTNMSTIMCASRSFGDEVDG